MTEIMMGMWPLFLIIIVFYFFIMRPQNKRQKEQTQFLSELEKGDEVITASGMYGRVNKIEGNVITLQVDTKTFIRVTRGAISKDMTDSVAKEENEKDKKS